MHRNPLANIVYRLQNGMSATGEFLPFKSLMRIQTLRLDRTHTVTPVTWNQRFNTNTPLASAEHQTDRICTFRKYTGKHKILQMCFAFGFYHPTCSFNDLVELLETEREKEGCFLRLAQCLIYWFECNRGYF